MKFDLLDISQKITATFTLGIAKFCPVDSYILLIIEEHSNFLIAKIEILFLSILIKHLLFSFVPCKALSCMPSKFTVNLRVIRHLEDLSIQVQFIPKVLKLLKKRIVFVLLASNKHVLVRHYEKLLIFMLKKLPSKQATPCSYFFLFSSSDLLLKKEYTSLSFGGSFPRSPLISPS